MKAVVVAITFLFGSSVVKSATVIDPYVQQVNNLVAAHQSSVSRLNTAATVTAQMLVAGGSFFLTTNNNQESALFYEGSGRSGGLMLVDEYPAPNTIHGGDVLWVSYSPVNYQSTISLVASVQQIGATVVVFGPQPPSGPPPFTYWIDSLTPWQSNDDFTLFGNVLSFWSATGELAAATARLGKTLVFWESVSVPGSTDRNAKYMGQLFHTAGQPQMAPVAAGVISGSYLNYVASMLGRIQSSGLSSIIATGQIMSTRAAASNPVTFVTLSHLVNFVPTLASNPLFNFVRTVTSSLTDTLKASGFLLDIGYAGVDDTLWQGLRAATGAKAAWIVIPSPYQSSPTQADFTQYGDTFINQQWDFGDCTVPVSGYDVCILPASGIAQLFIYESLLISGGYYNSSSAKPFATAQSFGGLNNGYTGWLGMQFTVVGAPLTVTSLGRAYFSGNTGTHTLKLVRASDGTDLPGGSVSLALQSGAPQQFQYATLASPVVLPANTSYYLVSNETAGGDQWSDNDQVATTNVAVLNGAVFTSGSSYAPQPLINYELGPVNFLYSTGGSPAPAVNITAPTSGNVSGKNLGVTANAVAATGLTISTVQFYLDNATLGNAISGPGPYGVTLDTTTLVNNSVHSLTARATDSAGGTTLSAAVSITINNSVVNLPPAVSITLPISGATVSGPNVQVTATAVAAAGLTISSVQFNLDGNPVGNPVAGPGPGFSYNLDSTKLPNGNHSISALATDSSKGSTLSTAVSLTVSNGSAASVAFATAQSLGPAYNSYSGWLGMYFTVGSAPLTVTSLGRMDFSGNTGTHTVKLVRASDGTDLPNGSVNVNLQGGTPQQFVYTALSTPLLLPANTSYYLVSQETAGADTWKDNDQVSTTNVASLNGAVYSIGSAYYPQPLVNVELGPVNFQYTTGGSSTPPAVSITAPSNGFMASGKNLQVSVTAMAATGLAISNVQLFVDGNAWGNPVTGSSPYSITVDTTLLSNSSHNFTAKATDSGGSSNFSTAVTIIVNNSGAGSPGGTPLVTVQSFGSLYNSYSGWLGMQFTVGGSPLTVGSLGRMCFAGNTGTHLLKLARASDGTDVAGASVSVNMTGCAPQQFQYATLSSAATLAANTAYYLVAQETSGGDQWSDNDMLTPSAVVTVNGAVYTANSTYLPQPIANVSLGPVNLLYSTGGSPPPSGPPTVAITTPVSGATASGKNYTVTASAMAASGLSIASVQFYLDGKALNAPVTTSPYSTSFDTTTYGDGTSHTLTAQATDSNAVSTLSAPVSFTINNSGPASQTFATVQSLGASYNSYTGWLGMKFTVGSAPITVTSLGRLNLPGNTGTHTLKLVRASDGSDVAGGSVTVNLAGGTSMQFSYAALSAPLTLPANTPYYLVSQETAGGDQWRDNTLVSTTNAAVLNGAVYSVGKGWAPQPLVNYELGPVNFLYH